MSSELYREARNTISNNNRMFIATAVSSIPTILELSYVNSGFDLYFFTKENSKTAAQLNINSKVDIIIGVSSKTKPIIYEGTAAVIHDGEEVQKISRKFGRKFAISQIRGQHLCLYKVTPLKIRYRHKSGNTIDDCITFPKHKESLPSSIITRAKSSAKLYAQATRMNFLPSSIGPLLIGAAAGWSSTGSFDIKLFLLSLIAMTLMHLGINLFNDYFDHISGTDEANKTHNLFSSGSRVIQKGLMSAEKVFIIASLFVGMSAGIGLIINSLIPGNILILLELCGILIGIGYSAIPYKLSYRWTGGIAVFITYGLLIPVGSYVIHSQGLMNWNLLIIAVPAAIMATLILYVNELQEYKHRQAKSAHSLTISIKQKRKAVKMYQVSLILPYIWIVIFSLTNLASLFSLLILLMVPLTIIAIIKAKTSLNKVHEFVPLSDITLLMHFVICVLTVAVYILEKFFVG